jgi:hypothetical protein
LSDLRSTLHYYEHVAEKGDEARQHILERTASQLKDILTMVTSKVEGTFIPFVQAMFLEMYVIRHRSSTWETPSRGQYYI